MQIVKDINEAISRVENFVAPANAKRLDKKRHVQLLENV